MHVKLSKISVLRFAVSKSYWKGPEVCASHIKKATKILTSIRTTFLQHRGGPTAVELNQQQGKKSFNKLLAKEDGKSILMRFSQLFWILSGSWIEFQPIRSPQWSERGHEFDPLEPWRIPLQRLVYLANARSMMKKLLQHGAWGKKSSWSPPHLTRLLISSSPVQSIVI